MTLDFERSIVLTRHDRLLRGLGHRLQTTGEPAFQGNPLVSDPPELRGIDRALRDQAHERISTRMSGNVFN